MPKVSKETATRVQELPQGKEWTKDLDGYSVSIVTVGGAADLTPLLKGLPNDQCQCPHWGYVFKGSMWFDDGKTRDVIEAGNAFYIPAGHTSGASDNTEFVIFSPTEMMEELEAHMAKRAQELQNAAH